jgi:hypothetical protein
MKIILANNDSEANSLFAEGFMILPYDILQSRETGHFAAKSTSFIKEIMYLNMFFREIAARDETIPLLVEIIAEFRRKFAELRQQYA